MMTYKGSPTFVKAFPSTRGIIDSLQNLVTMGGGSQIRRSIIQTHIVSCKQLIKRHTSQVIISRLEKKMHSHVSSDPSSSQRDS
jgi:hypothetical protein